MSDQLLVSEVATTDASAWRAWLRVFLATVLIVLPLLYVTIVVVDPYSTGRFSLTQRVDIATRNPRLVRAGLVRDPRFDAAIIGSSTGYSLDPARIGTGTKWRIVQLAILAALPPDQLVVANAFVRHHGNTPMLVVFVMDELWCRAGPPEAGAWGPFPTWLYESSDRDYLSRIFSSTAAAAAITRAGIWMGLARQAVRQDGYFTPKVTRAEARADVAKMRANPGGPPAQAPYPALDLLATTVAAIPADALMAFVFAPMPVNMLPPQGSVALARLDGCKQLVRDIAQRPGSTYLDLMTDNAMARKVEDFHSAVHYGLEVARMFEDSIAHALRDGTSQ